jgi:hypothetical protein
MVEVGSGSADVIDIREKRSSSIEDSILNLKLELGSLIVGNQWCLSAMYWRHLSRRWEVEERRVCWLAAT